MASYLKTNTAVTLCVGPFLDKTDGVTPETSLTVANSKITVIAETDDNNAPTLILDDVAGSDATNTLAHITNDDAGYYSLKLTAANLNRLGRLKVGIFDAANHCPVFHEYMVVPANVYDSIVLGTDYLDANAAQLGGTVQTGRDIGASVLLSSGTGTGQISLSSGAVTAGTVSDKTGYSLTTDYEAAKTALSSTDYTAAPTVAQIDTQLSSTHGSGTWGAGGTGGALSLVYTLTDSATALPIQGATVELYPTDAYSGVIDSQTTNVLGQVTFGSLVAGTYYLKIIKSGYEVGYDSEAVS